MQKIQRALGLLIVFLVPIFSAAESLTGVVADIHDGDTLTLQVPGDRTRYKVRLLGVDTPEVDFFNFNQGPAALQARDFLRGLAPVGATVSVDYETSGMDKHNRLLGRLIADGVDVNREMLRSGWGYLYFIFPFDRKLVVEYSALARTAVESKRGLFSEEFRDIEAPYDFRLRVRNQVGKNFVGDLEIKKLFGPDDSAKIPVWRRVFFTDSELARKNGYGF